MEQKVIIIDSGDTHEINDHLQKGWKVISVTAGHVSSHAGGNTYSSGKEYGKFCFVLER